MGENEYGESGHLSIFTLLEHLMMLLKYNFFSGLNFYTLSKTLIACRVMQLSETLLNNAFKASETSSYSLVVAAAVVAGLVAASLVAHQLPVVVVVVVAAVVAAAVVAAVVVVAEIAEWSLGCVVGERGMAA